MIRKLSLMWSLLIVLSLIILPVAAARVHPARGRSQL